MHIHRLVATVSFVFVACGSSSGGGGGAPGVDGGVGPTVDAGPDAGDAGPTVDLFRTDRVLEVAIELAADDWAALRRQYRSFADIVTGDCQDDVYAVPFTYFPATLTVDGVTVADVGVRKKGFIGSNSIERPAFKIKLDEYVDGQELLGRDDMLLNNSVQDGTYMRQCLGFGLFSAAGLPAPRCNFAHVTVNGEDLGLYVHVERVDRDFLRRHFDDASGNLYEGVYSDFRDGWLATFEPETNEDTTADRSDLAVVAAVLTLPDDQLEAALEQLIDVDQFITFWAVEGLIRHGDGYSSNANNFHVYRDPATGKLVFIPHGLDQIMRAEEVGHTAAVSVYSESLLASRLLAIPSMRVRYVGRLRELFATVWSPEALSAEVARLRALLEPVAGHPYGSGLDGWSFDEEIARLTGFITGRRAAVEAELATHVFAPDTVFDTVCWPEVGTVSATFATTYGTLEQDAFAAGSGTVDASFGGGSRTPVRVGARAGLAPPGYFETIEIEAELDDGTFAVIAFLVPANELAPATIVPDWVLYKAVLTHVFPATGSGEIVGFLGPAVIELEQAGTAPGAAVVGTVTGSVAWRY